MLARAQISRPAPGASVRSAKRQRAVRATAQTTETTPAQTQGQPQVPKGSQEIYIGHEKEDYISKAKGEKGRFVVDDPTKYPGRTEYTGGWAGGEAGLKAFVADYNREKELNKAPAAKKGKAKREPVSLYKGDDVIYLGNGRTIVGDARKYPDRTELTGGFAGGELGLKAFKENGDIPIAPNGQGKKQSSPLVIAFVLGLAATGGGLLLSTVEEVGEKVLGGEGAAAAIGASSMDEKTKLMLASGIALVGVVGTLAGTKIFVDTAVTKVRSGASKLAILGGFWVAVFLAAKAVLDSP